MRIGHGYDAHKFISGRGLILGGVSIDYNKKLLAHSDGDVVIHALCDALLGAAGMGDIGQHYPDSDKELAGIDSRIILRGIINKITVNNFSVGNVDITVVAQQPKLSSYMDKMRENLSADLGIPIANVNIKATTTEGLGFTGRSEGIESYAVVLLESD